MIAIDVHDGAPFVISGCVRRSLRTVGTTSDSGPSGGSGLVDEERDEAARPPAGRNAIAQPDARTPAKGAAGRCRRFADLRDVARALFSRKAVDRDAVGGAIRRIEEDRARGNAHLARRLAEQGLLRVEVDADRAADVL